MLKRYQKSLVFCKNSGFTLIELLVVVLIIGILSAVAVPMYQTAVDKTQFSTLLAVGQAFKEDQEIFYLANGHYSQNLNEIQPSLPSGWIINASGSAASSNSQILRLEMPVYFVLVNTPQRPNSLVIYYDKVNSPNAGKRHCYAYNDYGERGVKVCKSFGGVLLEGSSTCNGRCTIYRLP